MGMFKNRQLAKQVARDQDRLTALVSSSTGYRPEIRDDPPPPSQGVTDDTLTVSANAANKIGLTAGDALVLSILLVVTLDETRDYRRAQEAVLATIEQGDVATYSGLTMPSVARLDELLDVIAMLYRPEALVEHLRRSRSADD